MKIVLTLVFLINSFLFAAWQDIDELPSATLHKKVEHLNIIEALQSIGYPEYLAKDYDKVIRAQQPIVIIDGGFVGLIEYLKAHPEKKQHIKEWINYYPDGKASTESHGFDVYTSALATSPNADFYLFQFDIQEPKTLEKILQYMKKKHLYLANFSIGTPVFIGRYENTYLELEKLLEKYEITFFNSIANERGNSHYFQYSDLNGNKILEFMNPDELFRKQYEYNPIHLEKDKEVVIRLYWHYDVIDDVKDSIEIQLVDKSNKLIATSKTTSGNFVYLKYKPEKTEAAFIKVTDKGIKQPVDKYFTLHVKGAFYGYDNSYFNGFGIASKETLVESPFLISIGSYGKSEDGKLAPSSFSSFAKTVDGKVLPHILGPGQLVVDGKKIQGTSFSSPFISGFFAKFTGYNLKNLVESVSNVNGFSQSVKEIESGRWGIPDVMSLNKSTCLASDVIENMQQRVEGTDIVISVDFSRKCMEGLSYMLFTKLSGVEVKQGAQVMVPLEKYYKSNLFKSKTKDIEKTKVEFKIPLQELQKKFAGTKLAPQFFIATKSSDYILLSGSISRIPIEVPEVSSADIVNLANHYYMTNENTKALELINKILSETSQKNNEDVISFNFMKIKLLLRLNQYDEARKTLNSIEKLVKRDFKEYEEFQTLRIAFFYAYSEHQKVIDEVDKLNKAGFHSLDLAVLEYFSNQLFKQPKEFKADSSESSQLLDKYLKKELDYISYYNSLGKISLKVGRPTVFTNAFINFINMQSNIVSGVEKSKQNIINHGKEIFGTYYIDSIYYIIAKAQLGLAK